jgi:cytoskeleton protein RodZ
VTISAPASPEASPTSTFPPDSTAPGNARPDAADEEAPTAPNEEPVNTTPPPLQVATSRIRLEALEDASVQIFDAEGGLIAERNIRAGEVFYVPDKSGYTLATGNAGAVRLQVDGRNMPPLGDEDEAMHNIPLNPVLLLKYLQ